MYSVINNTLEVSNENPVVSILRKPNGSNPEHAFIIVEGVNTYGKAYFIRYDLFVDDDNPKKALISIKKSPVLESGDRKTYFAELLHRESVYAQSWNISAEEARNLEADANRDKANPPDYQISGDKSLIAKSSANEGHSCFSWAREKLLNLRNPNIQFETKLQDFIIAQTSKHIIPPQHHASVPGCTLL